MLFPILYLSTLILNSADSSQHPIDKQLYNCLQQSHATMPRARCYSTTSDLWEKDIYATQKKLLLKATTAQKKKLRENQQDWEKERDKEFAEIADRYNFKRGTGYIPVRIELRMKVLRKRALELESALNK